MDSLSSLSPSVQGRPDRNATRSQRRLGTVATIFVSGAALLAIAGCWSQTAQTPVASVASSVSPTSSSTTDSSMTLSSSSPSPSPSSSPSISTKSTSTSSTGSSASGSRTAASSDLTGEPGSGDSTDGPQVVPTSASGRTLGLADIFSTVGEWKEERYDISDTSNVFGLATTLSSCGGSGVQLELRLAHRFSTLQMKVGQANNSMTSDDVVVVDVVKNGTKIDSQGVAFDVVQPFKEDVTDANSLKIAFQLDPAKCSNQGVVVVVEGLTVS